MGTSKVMSLNYASSGGCYSKVLLYVFFIKTGIDFYEFKKKKNHSALQFWLKINLVILTSKIYPKLPVSDFHLLVCEIKIYQKI